MQEGRAISGGRGLWSGEKGSNAKDVQEGGQFSQLRGKHEGSTATLEEELGGHR